MRTIVVLLAALLAWTTLASAGDTPAGSRWEYLLLAPPKNGKGLSEVQDAEVWTRHTPSDVLVTAGREGWEVCFVHLNGTVLLKRQAR